MTYPSLAERLTARLDQADRGDRGWFLITRVHLNPAHLKGIAEYLHAAGRAGTVELTGLHYSALGELVGTSAPDPGILLRRHQLLAMESPLNLLQRVSGTSWHEVALTDLGAKLATEDDAPRILEEALSQIVFCRAPWYQTGRIGEYAEFDVKPFEAMLEVLNACDGWTDRDEFDLFVSRIRSAGEVQQAVDSVRTFRTLDAQDRASLLREVRTRIPSPKTYQNWRDMGLHTFTLLGLGLSMSRADQSLVLTSQLATARDASGLAELRRPTAERARMALRMPVPEPHATPGLAAPPGAPLVNPGDEAEFLVGKLLVSLGWNVVYYGSRRGFGFDLWAAKGGSAILVEVKSSTGSMGTITLTRLEYEAARVHAENYVLAIVENISSESPAVGFIQNPAEALSVEQINTVEYRISRVAWSSALVSGQSSLT